MKLSIALLLLASTCFAQKKPCDLIKQDEADAVLGASKQLDLGAMGCSYSNRDKGVRITLVTLDVGTAAAKTYEGLKQKTKDSGWLFGDEGAMGSAAYAELIKRSAQSSSGKCGFVVLKGNRVIQIHVSDSANKDDLAGKKEMLDKLRPLAKKIVERS